MSSLTENYFHAKDNDYIQMKFIGNTFKVLINHNLSIATLTHQIKKKAHLTALIAIELVTVSVTQTVGKTQTPSCI